MTKFRTSTLTVAEHRRSRSRRRHLYNASVAIGACLALLFWASEAQKVDQARYEARKALEATTEATAIADKERSKAAALERTLAKAQGLVRSYSDRVLSASAELQNTKVEVLKARDELVKVRLSAANQAQQVQVSEKRTATYAQAFEEQRLRAVRITAALIDARVGADNVKTSSIASERANSAAIENANGLLLAERERVRSLERSLLALRQTLNDARVSAQAARDNEARSATEARNARSTTERIEIDVLAAQQQAAEARAKLLSARQALESALRASDISRSAVIDERKRSASLAEQLTAAQSQIEKLEAIRVSQTIRVEPAVPARDSVKNSRERRAKPRRPQAEKFAVRRFPSKPQLLPASLLPTQLSVPTE